MVIQHDQLESEELIEGDGRGQIMHGNGDLI
jgi:hypothetical protein